MVSNNPLSSLAVWSNGLHWTALEGFLVLATFPGVEKLPVFENISFQTHIICHLLKICLLKNCVSCLLSAALQSETVKFH